MFEWTLFTILKISQFYEHLKFSVKETLVFLCYKTIKFLSLCLRSFISLDPFYYFHLLDLILTVLVSSAPFFSGFFLSFQVVTNGTYACFYFNLRHIFLVLTAAVTQASLQSIIHKFLTAGPSAFNITSLISQAAQLSTQGIHILKYF